MKIFLGSFLMIIQCANTFAQDWYESGNIDYFEDYQNIIHENVILTQSANVAYIDITDSMYIENHGIINGNLFSEDYTVSINNMGIINGTVTAPNVTWIIKSEDAVNNIPTVTSQNFSVTVQDILAGSNFDHGINLNQLQNLNADSFDITNSAIIIDNYSDWQNWNANVSLSQATLIINDFSDLVSGQVINHVANQLDVSAIILNGAQGTYSIELVGQNTVILNITPISGGENNLFTMPPISNTYQNNTSLSYQFNPSILMRPIRVINNFLLVDSLFSDMESGVGIKPFYIMSDDTNSAGTKLYLNNKYHDVYHSLSLHLNSFNYKNEFNDFSGIVYGGDINIKKYMDSFWIKGLIGGSIISFKTDSIFVGGNTKNNPTGYYVYGGIDGGYDYKFDENITIAPLVGVTFERFGVTNFSDNDINMRVGGNAKYKFDVDGISYEYSVSGLVNTNCDLIGMAKIGFISVADKVGLNLGFDAIKSKDYTAYKISINGKLVF